MRCTPYRFVLTGLVLLTLIACSTGDVTRYRPGLDIRADLDDIKKAKFILEVGHRGFITIGDREYGFKLDRINTPSNVTVEMLDTGDTVELPSQITKQVQPGKDAPPVTFELSTVMREYAIIYVRKSHQPPPEMQAQPETESKEASIRIALTVLEETTINLRLDDEASKAIPLPKGTRISWEAKKFFEITIPEPGKAGLEINGTVYRSADPGSALHIIAQLQDGDLTIVTGN